MLARLVSVVAAFLAPRRHPTPADLPVLRGRQDAPFVGHKRAYLVLAADSSDAQPRVRFSAFTSPELYDVTAEAVCVRNRHAHTPPADDCACGFYALSSEQAIRSFTFSGAAARLFPAASHQLEVALFGTVIEGSAGFRASGQQVQLVRLSPNCSFCHQPAARVIPRPRFGWLPRLGGRFLVRRGRMAALDSACEACAASRPVPSFTAAQLSSQLGVPVVFDPPLPRHRARMRRLRRPWSPASSLRYGLLAATSFVACVVALMTATVRIHPFVAGLSAFLVLPLAVGGVVLYRLSLTTPDNRRGLLYSLLLLPWMSLTFTALVATTALLGTPAWAGF